LEIRERGIGGVGAEEARVVHDDHVAQVRRLEDSPQFLQDRRLAFAFRRRPGGIVTVQPEEGRPVESRDNRPQRDAAVPVHQLDVPIAAKPAHGLLMKIAAQLDRDDPIESMLHRLDHVPGERTRLHQDTEPV
jgi:hypothetical protein